MPFDTNHFEFKVAIDSIIKGHAKDTVSVFNGNCTTILFNFKPECWSANWPMKGIKYVFFLKIDSLATNQIKKPIYYYYYSLRIDCFSEILENCNNAIKNNCKNKEIVPYDTSIINRINKEIIRNRK
jgi:hypothetical protein